MEYLLHISILVSIYAVLGLSLNLVVGYTGLLSVTHAAFYGIGAYATALLMIEQGLGFFAAVPLAMLITGACALLIGAVLSRFSGDYYALGSFGFNVIVFSVLLNWQELTRGPLGIPGIPRPELFGISFADNGAFLLLCVILGAFALGVCAYLTRSSFGRVLMAIREDEGVASVFGYSTAYYKLIVFVVAAMLAALAGGLLASYITFIDPSSFSLNESIFILAIIILGGLASHEGAIAGAFFLIVLPELLRFLGFPSDVAAQMRQVTYGAILVALMLYRPQGFLGTFRMN